MGVLGDHFDIKATVTDIPAAQTAVEAWATVKDSPDNDATDALAKFQKHITTVDSADGQITDGGSGSGATRKSDMVFHLLPIDTSGWVHQEAKQIDIQIKYSGGAINTPFRGTISGIKGITNKIT